MSVPPHTRHKHIKNSLRVSYSHLSLPTDHTTAAYRLQPWPGHTVLSGATRQPPAPPRRSDRDCVAKGAEIRVLGSIDREEEYGYTPRVQIEQLEESTRIKLSLESRLLRSYDAAPRLLRPLHHVSGARPLTPPPGPLSVRPSRVLLDAHALIDKSREVQREREKRFLRRIRHNPLFPPDLSRDKATEEALVAFSATCLGQPMRKPLTTLSSLQQALDESRQKLKISSRINIPRPVGTLEAEFKIRNAPMRRPRLPPDHLLVVSSPLAPSSPGDIISLCSLREGLRTLKEKGNKRIK